MQHHWNWTAFFRRHADAAPAGPSAHAVCRDLPRLTFEQGLWAIVSSVPQFDHEQWQVFCEHLNRRAAQHPDAETWLTVGRLVRDSLDTSGQLLNHAGDKALTAAKRELAQRHSLEQFAWMACLHYHGRTSLQARLMFNELLSDLDPDAERIANTRAFYHSLTSRQREVAVLAARGLTNEEISAELCIEEKTVAEHLTHIYIKFETAWGRSLEEHARRYRLIHWLTRLLERQPHLLDRL